ncbi:MAG: hypothetical protein EA428_01730, partial [Spirochaetaceae bacterium]
MRSVLYVVLWLTVAVFMTAGLPAHSEEDWGDVDTWDNGGWGAGDDDGWGNSDWVDVDTWGNGGWGTGD